MQVEVARSNMIKQQLRAWAVLDDFILDLFQTIRRENFVPTSQSNLAFADTMLPLGKGEAMWQPKQEARVLQELTIEPHESVLEIGTGSGFLTALLAWHCRKVLSIDIYPEFIAQAQHNLAKYNLPNIELVVGDAANGWQVSEPFNVIIITGSLPFLPNAYKEAITVGGRIFVILGKAPVMQATIIKRVAQEEWQEHILFETEVAQLQNALQPEQFVF